MRKKAPANAGAFAALDQASDIEPVGHSLSQAPQSMQVLASISNFESPAEIAPTGHAFAQAPHDTHPSLICLAMIFPPLVNIESSVCQH
jgi:hypothetical protein